MVKWKDILTGLWHGPDPVLTWARGSVCVFPQDRQDPVWIPERLIRRVQNNENQETGADCTMAHPTDDSERTDEAEMGDSFRVSMTNTNSLRC